MARPVIGFVGIGKVGETLARLLHHQGYSIGAIYNRTHKYAQQLAPQIQSQAVSEIEDVLRQSDLIFLTVSDDAIQSIAGIVSQHPCTGKAFVHVSGSRSLSILKALHEDGNMIGNLHPAFPFSSVDQSMQSLLGTTFAIQYSDDKLRHWLIEIVESLQGHIIEIPEGQKPQYHLALAILSNYTVTLYSVAHSLLSELTDDTMAINQALNTLLLGTTQNLIEQGIPDALTGPLVRNDLLTISSHLNAVSKQPLLSQTYKNLARLSYPMLQARGIDINRIDDLLRQESDDAADNS